MARLPEPGTEWAGFRIEEEIGEGGFGRVFAAWDPALQRRVALKVLATTGDDEADTGVRARFLRESRLAAGLDHPRIVPIHTASEYEGIPYLVMRFVDGGDLRSELRQGPLSLARTVSVVSQIADALDRAHRSGLVHRDVKPANILCVADGDDVYLTDFGITRPIDQPAGAGLTRTGELPASPHYASPEQLTGEGELGPATDVYSLGCTAFECLTGRVPFPGRTHLDVGHQHLHADRPTVSQHRPDLPPALDDVLATAMAVDPADRFPTCGALADALAAVRDGAGPPPVAPGAPPAPTDPALSAVPDGGRSGDETRSVFAGDQSVPATDATVVDDVLPPDEPLERTLVVTGPRVVEVEWDDPDADRPRSRTPWIVGGVLLVAAVVVGLLVVRAVNTDSGVDRLGAGTTTTVADTTPAVAPTMAALRALVPDSLDTCVPPPEGSSVPEGQVRLVCPRDTAPDLVTFTLFADRTSVDTAFDDAVASLELDPGAPGECALADDVVQDYVGAAGRGRVACRTEGSRVDIVWTRGDAPMLGTAGGVGFYGAYYRFWSDLVGRTDAAFPLPIESDLLAELPEDLLDGCRRDVDLTAQAPGVAAVVCQPADPHDGEATVVSWVRFADDATMQEWIADRLSALSAPSVERGKDACSSKHPPEPPAVGYTTYDLHGSTGTVLCFVNSSDQNVVFWTRDASRIGSIAVSGTDAGDLGDLLKWWEKDGHRP